LRNSCASLAGLVLCLTACFILLVIAPLSTNSREDLAEENGGAMTEQRWRRGATAGGTSSQLGAYDPQHDELAGAAPVGQGDDCSLVVAE